MKYLLLLTICLICHSCHHAPASDIEAIAEDVLKAKQGIDIEIKPIPKEAK